MAPATSGLSKRWTLFALFLITLIGLYLRVRAAQTEFWLDEVWSWQLGRTVGNPFEILTSIHHDNNHYLNTLWIYLLGDQKDWFLYRIPSLVTGTAAIVLVAVIGWRKSSFHGWAASLMVALSLLLVISSSEARGGMSAAFFALACYDQQDRYFSNGRVLNAILSTVFAVLGCLSHLSFLHAYLGLFLWSVAKSFAAKQSIRHFLMQVLTLHGPFVCFALSLYLVDVRFLRFGGAPPNDGFHALAETATLMLGGTTLPAVATGMFYFAAAIILVALGHLAVERSALFILYFGVLILGPSLFMLSAAQLSHFTSFYPRYFLVSVPFALMLMVDFFSRLNKCRPGKIVVFVLLAVFSFQSFSRSYSFAIDGRGHYFEAFSDILSANQKTVTVGSLYEFQLKKLLKFYARYLPPDNKITVIAESDWSSNPPEWMVIALSEVRTEDGLFIGHDESFGMKEIISIAGHQYKLERTYPYSGDLSGTHWLVYKRLP